MNSPLRSVETLSEEELSVISTFWKGERREIVTSFNGTSMLPTIVPGQRVIVECGVRPRIGNVVVFQRQSQIGVHRVVAQAESWLLTWGDANALPDVPIVPASVIGTIENVPAAPYSLRHTLLLYFLNSPCTSIGLLTRRVQFLHRVRAAWAQGLFMFARKALRAVFRRQSLTD